MGSVGPADPAQRRRPEAAASGGPQAQARRAPASMKGAHMQRRMSHRIPGVLFILAVTVALSLAAPPPTVANELVIAVWTSPEAENLKRAAPVIAQKTGLRVEIDEI